MTPMTRLTVAAVSVSGIAVGAVAGLSPHHSATPATTAAASTVASQPANIPKLDELDGRVHGLMKTDARLHHALEAARHRLQGKLTSGSGSAGAGSSPAHVPSAPVAAAPARPVAPLPPAPVTAPVTAPAPVPVSHTTSGASGATGGSSSDDGESGGGDD